MYYNVSKGVAVGCGWQTFVAYVNVGCYYGIGIPLGSVLGFYFKLSAKVCYSIGVVYLSHPKASSDLIMQEEVYAYI